MIASTSASVAEPIFSASRMRRAGVHSAWRRCALGMCSGIVVCRFLTAENAWLATRVPRWKISIVVLVILASTACHSPPCDQVKRFGAKSLSDVSQTPRLAPLGFVA